MTLRPDATTFHLPARVYEACHTLLEVVLYISCLSHGTQPVFMRRASQQAFNVEWEKTKMTQRPDGTPLHLRTRVGQAPHAYIMLRISVVIFFIFSCSLLYP